MMEMTILSGKGGTGKTSITAALSGLVQSAVLCDNDVDAADLHLILHPDIIEEHAFASGWKAEIDTSKCKRCDICLSHCRFDAIHTNAAEKLVINPFQCEGCRLCERICPEQAIRSEQYTNNYWYVSNTRFGTLVHAKMGPGEENSGKLVTQVRKKAKEIALTNQKEWIINDGPPGIGCAAIASLTGTDLALIVIEPSKSSLHDADRLIKLIESFKIPVFALINKFDLNLELSQSIANYLKTKNIPLVAKIPFDKAMVHAMINKQTIVEYQPNSNISKEIKKLWHKIQLSTHTIDLHPTI
ncbi:MinD superfamily P-loop ATPase [Ancylomarina subtilis]|uniref:MinD superfamily P-loop ATPase n=1 Tax=Ancylomarina subtilis TaxID=1639035 RepID=A0A4Q7VHH7_9BACT|nr:ATP-binding protein [Ancylomarina subtilis]RZT95550.1 MinD superfamily P-loop ATPase [Ancylomarina subtilis]